MSPRGAFTMSSGGREQGNRLAGWRALAWSLAGGPACLPGDCRPANIARHGLDSAPDPADWHCMKSATAQASGGLRTHLMVRSRGRERHG